MAGRPLRRARELSAIDNPSNTERRQLYWLLQQKIEEIEAMRGPEDIPPAPARVPLKCGKQFWRSGETTRAPGYDRWLHFRQAYRKTWDRDWDAFKAEYIRRLQASFPK